MKKKLLASSVVAALAITPLLGTTIANAATVSIPDPFLTACINKELGHADDAPLIDTELEGITKLDCSGPIGAKPGPETISDLTGIDALTNIVILDLSWNTISDLSPLSGFKNIIALDLGTNLITDVSPLSSLTSLINLELIRNSLTTVDSLGTLTNVKTLGIWFNQITNIDVVSSLVSIEQLNISVNKITDISPMNDLPNLSIVNASNNQISDISSVKDTCTAFSVTCNLINQQFTLDPVEVNTPVQNFIKDLDGVAIPLTSSTAEYDAASDSWMFKPGAPKANTLEWSVDLDIASGSVYSGTISQEAIDNTPAEALKPVVILSPAAGAQLGQSPRFSGTGNPSAAIALTDQNGKVWATGVVQPDGTWTLDVTGTVPQGSFTFTVSQKDATTQEDLGSSSVSVTVTNQTATAQTTSASTEAVSTSGKLATTGTLTSRTGMLVALALAMTLFGGLSIRGTRRQLEG